MSQCIDLDSGETQKLLLSQFPSTFRFGRVQLRRGPAREIRDGVRAPGKKSLFVRPGGKIFTAFKKLLGCGRRRTEMARRGNAPTRVEYESGTSTPFQGTSFTLNDRNGTQVQNITPQRLREMRSNPGTAHEGVEARSSILPRGSEVFDQGAMMARIARRVGLRSPQVVQPLRHVENPTGLVRGQTVLDVPIDIVPARQAISSDDRLPSRVRDQGSESTFVRVGAVEVAIEGLAAQGTDNVIAAVLYDARHGEPRNSIRGVQISSAAAVPTRVVYFPSTRLVNNSRVNEALRLAVVSPNSDMEGWEVAAVRTGVVAQIDEGSHQERLTRRTLQNEGEDRAMAAAYADHNCVVLTPPQLEVPVHGSFRIPLGRQTSMRMVEDGRWEEVVAPQRFAQVDLARRSDVGSSRGPLLRGGGVVRNWDERVPEVDNHVLLPEENGPSEARAQNNMEVNTGTVGEPNVCLDKDFTFLPEASETDLFLHSFTADIATNLVPGRVLCKVPIQSVVDGAGRSARALKYAISVDRAIKVVMNCKLAPMSALGIGAAFVDSGETASTVSCKEYLSMQSSIWNPAANSYHVFYLDPCKVGVEWYPHWAGSLNSHFVLFMVDGWSNPPKTPARVMGSFYLADRKVRETSYMPMSLGSRLQINKYLGTFELAQGANDKAQRVELSLGSPSVVSVGYVSTVGTQLLALNAYWQGKMVVQFTRTGSSFVGATLACALVLGGDSRAISLADIAMIPHHTFVVQAEASSIIQEFPVSSMGMMYSTDRRVLHGDSRAKRGLQLAIWVKDSVTSVTDDKLKFAVRVLALEDLRLGGQNGGYPTKARAQYSPTELKYYDVAIFDGPLSGRKVSTSKDGGTVVSTRSSSKLKIEAAQTPQSSDDEGTGVTGQVVQLPVPNFWKFQEEGSSGSTHICSTPLSLLLDSAAYFKGTVYFKVTWIANRDIKRSDMKGNFAYSVHPCGPESYASERKCFADTAGTTEFKVDVCGPLNGYLPFHMERDILAIPCVKLYITKPLYMQSVHVQCALGENVSVAGHHVSADIKVEGASSWSEFHVD